MLAFVMAVAIASFLGYHLFLVYKGQTTNESHKWKSVYTFHNKLVKAHKAFLASPDDIKVMAFSNSRSFHSDHVIRNRNSTELSWRSGLLQSRKMKIPL